MPVSNKRNPELTRERILEAATDEFAEKGFGSARVDAIALKAGANKRMLYHYYGNKEDLFVAVLEHAYQGIRNHEQALDLESLDPDSAMRELIRFTFGYFVDHPEFIRLLNNENLYGASHIKRSRRVLAMHTPLVDQLRQVLQQGEGSGVFRPGVDPIQLYITVAGLGYFYLSNAATLGTIFGVDLTEEEALKMRLVHITEVILGYLQP
ncbi:MAG: TetR/AcrR family transcriptional regulator [Gammaproteobacteria bacterium]|nr:TetR/AcrR family transcriptional regulator [Gammaproteobacteria bacterium]